MSRQHGGKGESSEASPLSLLVHAADSQRSSGKKGGQGKPGENGAGQQRDAPGARIPEGAPSSSSLEDHMAQRQAAARAEALHHHGLLSQFRGGNMGESEFYQQNSHLVAAQQQQQAAALALASDIRTAVAAAQLRQAAQYQNQDFYMNRSATLQQFGLVNGQQIGGGGVEQLQQELELHRLEEMERRQLIAQAAAGGPMGGALAARQQLELQEAQIRQEQYERQMGGSGGGQQESMLDRAGLRAPMDPGGGRGASSDAGSKDSFQKTPGSVVVPCRARGMPMDHNFKTAYFVIPENVEHGEELICSYFACRNAGIKFRYCTHCKVPVAKRNFRKRHKHGKTNAGGEGEEDASVEEEEDASIKAAKNLEEAKKVASSMGGGTSPPFDIHKKEIPTPKVAEKMKSKPVATGNDAESRPSLPPISHQARPKISLEREHLWGGLLAKRPPTKDGEAVSAWLMEVLSVSDLDTPLKENGQVAPNAGMALPFKSRAAAHLAAASKDAAAASMLMKKKRPLAVLQKDEKEDAGSISDKGSSSSKEEEDGETPSKSKKDVGSFAEWKDRKKHKGLPKKGFSMQSE